jgi:hypothetical protein
VSGQPFPPGADVGRGRCRAPAHVGDPLEQLAVVHARLGPTWRQAQDVSLCADCLADFAVAASAFPPDVKVINVDFPDGRAVATEVPRLHVYVLAEDGRFHEVTGESEADGPPRG